MIFLKKNAMRDPYYSVHGPRIKVGEIVKLVELDRTSFNASYPAEIYVTRSKQTGDDYKYKASLCCFDFVKAIRG